MVAYDSGFRAGGGGSLAWGVAVHPCIFLSGLMLVSGCFLGLFLVLGCFSGLFWCGFATV